MTTTLFGLGRSRLRKRLLVYYFSNTEAVHHLREIASILGEDPGNLSKELARLCAEAVFHASVKGRQKYFSLNTANPFFPDLRSIIAKTVGIEARLGDEVKRDEAVLIAFIYGSCAGKGLSPVSDVDVMLITKDDGFDDNEFLKLSADLKKETGREIDFTHFPKREWIARSAKRDSFIISVIKGPRIMLKGDEKDLRRLTAARDAH